LIAFFTHIWGSRQKEVDQTREDKRKDIELKISLNQKELDLKIDLVNKINSSVTEIIMVSLYGENANKSREISYYEWEVSRATIASNLQAYYPDKDILSKWENYYHLLECFYIFTGLRDKGEPEYEEYLDKIKQCMSDSSFRDWDSLKTDPGSIEYSESLTHLAEEIEKQKEVLVKEVLNSRIEIYIGHNEQNPFCK
jgi:hypothetical protein